MMPPNRIPPSRTPPNQWRELLVTDEVSLARIVLVSIASMEFDVRCTDAKGRAVWSFGDADAHREQAATTETDEPALPLMIEVPERDLETLLDLLPEIVHEQDEFDAHLASSHARSQRTERIFLFVVITIAAIVAGLVLMKN